ncbi:fibronectin type III domain-containing protein [Bdellovibrionota bacterium FG-1]
MRARRRITSCSSRSLASLTLISALGLCACEPVQMDEFLEVLSGSSQYLSLTATAEVRNFGIQSLKAASAEKTITVHNESSEDVYVSSILNTDSAFEIVSHDCPIQPLALVAGTTCKAQVTFAPTKSGNTSNLFTVIYGKSADKTTNYTITLELTGQGEGLVPFAGIDAFDQITSSSARIRWTAPTGAKAFIVYQINTLGAALPLRTLTEDATNISLTGLTPATAYTYRVRVEDENGGMDTNTNDKTFFTDSIGVFSSVETQFLSEGETVSIPLDCSDTVGNTAAFSLVAQSDSLWGTLDGAGAGCSVSSGKLDCTVPYRAGHSDWTASAEVRCSINGSTLSRTIEFQIADTNRPPHLTPSSSLTTVYPSGTAVIAGATEVNKDFSLLSSASGTNLGDVDEDDDAIVYTCGYESAATEPLLPGTYSQNCSGVPAKVFSFGASSGVFAWTPRYQDGNKFFGFRVTATEQGVSTPSSSSATFRVFVNFAGEPMLSLDSTSLNMGNVGVGAQALSAVTVTNNSQSIAALGSIAGSSPHFAINSQTCAAELLPAQTCTITFAFAPVLPEAQSASFTLSYGLAAGNTPFQLGVALTGTANPSAPTAWSQTTDTVTGGGGFQLNWVDQSTSETSFEVQRCTGAACAATFTAPDSADSATISASNQSTYLWSGLTEGNVYRFRVRAQRGSLNSDWLTGPTQVFFKGIVSISNETGDTIKVNWTSAAGANSYIITNVTGASLEVIATVIAPASTVTLTNLTPSTTFRLRVNLLRSDNIPDSNTKEVQSATLAVVATHNGWTEISAFGPRVSADIVPVGDPIRAMEHGSYIKLKWNAMTVTNSSLQGYRIFRATSSGGQNFSSPLAETNPGVRTYTDSTVTAGVTYYYVIRPIAGSTAISTAAADSEVVVPVPPANMSLVHRWLANYDTCTTMARTVDREHNYRCPYRAPTAVNDAGISSWPTSSTDMANPYYYDIGSSHFVDRFEAGCNFTSGRISKLAGVAPGAGVGNTGDVYYDRSNQYCYYKRAGNIWLRQDSASLTAAERAVMASNKPGLPPLVNVAVQTAHNFCVARNTTTNEYKLPSIRRNLAASVWPVSIWSYPGINAMEQSHAGGNPVTTLYPLYDNYYCNNNAGYGLTYENSDYPSDLTANALGLLPTNIETIPTSNVAGGAVRTGSLATKNCISRYGIQDAVGNIEEWTSDQVYKQTDGFGTARRGLLSNIDPTNTDFYNISINDGAPSLLNTTCFPTFSVYGWANGWFNVPIGQCVTNADYLAFDAIRYTTTPGVVDVFGRDSIDTIEHWAAWYRYSAALGAAWGPGINGFDGRWSARTPAISAAQSSARGFRCISDRVGLAAQILSLTQGNVATPRSNSTCVSLTLKGLNTYGDATIAGTDRTITLSGAATGGSFYSDSSCAVSISSLNYTTNQYINTPIYYKDAGTETAILSATSAGLTSAAVTLIVAAQTAPVLELDAARASSTEAPYAAGCNYDSEVWWDIQHVSNAVQDGSRFYGQKCASSTTGWRGTGVPADPYRLTFTGNPQYQYLQTSLYVSPAEMPATSWEVWVQQTNQAGRVTILSAEDSTYDRNLSIEGGTAKFCMTTGAAFWCPGVTATNATWQHIVAVWTAGDMYLYVNGTKATRGSAPGAAVSATPLFLGVKPYTGEYLYGSIGQVRVYNRALTDSDVCTNFNATRGTFNIGTSGSCP